MGWAGDKDIASAIGNSREETATTALTRIFPLDGAFASHEAQVPAMIAFKEYCLTVARNFEALSQLEAPIESACDVIKKALRSSGKIMFCGNGGSAADSQHLAAELMGRFAIERAPLAALALTVDTSALTAIGNDYSFDDVFARQLRGIGRAGDVLIGISTSGNSGNVLRALQVAREMSITAVGLTGHSGGRMRELCDVCIAVPATRTNHIQEMHIAVGHFICAEVERDLCASKGEG